MWTPFLFLFLWIWYYNNNNNIYVCNILNIARGTTDPEIDSVTGTKVGNNMAPLALVANLATSWRHLH